MGSMDVIYADELFALNGIIDYLLLLSAARLRGGVLRRGRFALAAVLGGGYALAAVLPGLAWLQSLGIKLALSLAMAWIAYGGGAGLWKSWACFLGLSAAFGGAVYGASLLAGGAGRAGACVPARTGFILWGLLCGTAAVFRPVFGAEGTGGGAGGGGVGGWPGRIPRLAGHGQRAV